MYVNMDSPFILFFILFVLSTGLFLFVGLQVYLAKYSSNSILYWRQIAPIHQLILYFLRHPLLRSVTYCLGVLSYSEFSFREYLLVVYHFFDFYRLRTLFQRLDDIIDETPPNEILNFGQAKLGTELSLFLEHIDALLTNKERALLNRFIAKQLISKQALYAFGNVIAQQLCEQARLTNAYMLEMHQDKKIELRQKIAQTNLAVAGCYCVLAIHFIKKDPRISDIVQQANRPLTYTDIKTIYPRATKGSELMQIMHDVPEFRTDLVKEKLVRKITPNYFLAALEPSQNAVLQQSIEHLPKRTVNFYELAQDIQVVFLTLQHEFMKQTWSLNPITRWLFTILWEYNYLIGFLAKK